MNIAYSRKSTKTVDEVVTNIKASIDPQVFSILGEMQIQDGTVINICASAVLQQVIAINPQLIGLMPCSIAVTKEEQGSRVSVGDPTLIGQVTQDPELHQTLATFHQQLMKLVNQGAGVGMLKPEKIKLYATTSCPYCKMEADWLTKHNVEFEEVLVDLNQQAAEDLVRRTGQMGVPVTEIRYLDADPDFVVGFDRNRLTSVLGLEA